MGTSDYGSRFLVPEGYRHSGVSNFPQLPEDASSSASSDEKLLDNIPENKLLGSPEDAEEMPEVRKRRRGSRLFSRCVSIPEVRRLFPKKTAPKPPMDVRFPEEHERSDSL